ncbi:ABC transporter ATP-binding protein [Atopobacter sp. AH10]|uniref:energy-coupling factor ABC transporter ATP-binding protein n=1 Tax=Atopobacter sp. AH10 TaxID=2315861 RepID=UPI000EF22815|nr:ABC transporter ATP-binding protein [Atopobacter sp. AH10]RLK63445.1 ABC transporter ATP-binding protein [Atopobacter sp. AH10]
MALIELKGVNYRYPLAKKEALKGINLTFEAGKMYGLVGANQSGKTTLVQVIRGFLPNLLKGNLSGLVTFKGQDVSSYNIGALAAFMGYSSQNPFTQISGVKDTVEEEIVYGMENLGFDREKMQERLEKVLADFNLTGLRGKNPYDLSGGQKQRVALASIVAIDPEVIILDEPTSQLDPEGTAEIFSIVEQLKKAGKTIIMIEHKIDLLAECCDEIIVMEKGQVVLSGSTRTVLTDKNLIQYGVNAPQVTSFFQQFLTEIDGDFPFLKGSLQELPLTIEEAIKQLRGL